MIAGFRVKSAGYRADSCGFRVSCRPDDELRVLAADGGGPTRHGGAVRHGTCATSFGLPLSCVPLGLDSWLIFDFIVWGVWGLSSGN